VLSPLLKRASTLIGWVHIAVHLSNRWSTLCRVQASAESRQPHSISTKPPSEFQLDLRGQVSGFARFVNGTEMSRVARWFQDQGACCAAGALGTLSAAILLPSGCEYQEMNNPDQETLLRAIEDARRILGENLATGARDATWTVERLLAVLDKEEVVHALDRMNRCAVARLATGSKKKGPG
jgi:hypothetical protein